MRSYLTEYHEKTYGFRLRGHQITRVEAFSDAVFAIAITLLIFTNQMPTSYEEVRLLMRDFIPFGLCIILLVSLWNAHFNFFLRYGLEDVKTVALNALFLFLLLIYVFPLKFLASFLTEIYWTAIKKIFIDRGYYSELIPKMFKEGDIPDLMVFYGLGVAAIYLTLMLMYIRALKLRKILGFNEREVFETRMSIRGQFLMASVPLISVILVLIIGGSRGSEMSGFVYTLYWPVTFFHYGLAEKQRKKLFGQLES